MKNVPHSGDKIPLTRARTTMSTMTSYRVQIRGAPWNPTGSSIGIKWNQTLNKKIDDRKVRKAKPDVANTKAAVRR